MPFFGELETFLQDIPRHLSRKPKAILVISGHWEEREPTVMAHPHPPMLYDYYGFPKHTYEIRYDAPGAPDVAMATQRLLEQAGFSATLDEKRGFDHGVFAPLYVMYPKADVPIFQLSMKAGYDPETHFRIGRALASLRQQDVLIVGSGLSYHNLRNMLGHPEAARLPSQQFDQWLQETLVGSSPEERHRRLLAWAQAPSARAAHPQEDHLIPLLVAAGAAESDPAQLVHHELFVGAVTVSSFRFG
jgi:aromatic ring-opening dioxygenase catalytic subunit (LigB family)